MIKGLRAWALAALTLLGASLPAAGVVNGGFESVLAAPWIVALSPPGTGGGPPFVQQLSPGPIFDTNGNLNQVFSGIGAVLLDSGESQIQGSGGTALLQQTLVLPSGPLSVEFYLAAVLYQVHRNDPGDDAFFEFSVLTSGGAVLYGIRYNSSVSPAPMVDDGLPGLFHLPWTRIAVDLSAWAGSTVILRFRVQECSYGVHDANYYVDGVRLLLPGTPTPTPTRTVTRTFSPTRTITLTRTPTPTATESATATPSSTVTPTPSVTPTWTHSPTATSSFTVTPSHSHSPTATPTPTATATFTASPTATPTPTITPTPSVTPTYSFSPTVSPTPPDLYLTPKQPNPNPSSGSSIWMPYLISADAWVDIKVFDIAGETVRSLDPVFQRAGAHERQWDLRNHAGNGVASGIFLYRIRAKGLGDQEDEAWMKCAVAR